LGIPGTPPDAVILGALLVQGVRTGPTLFQSGGSIVYTFIYGLLIATILMLPVGLLIGRYAYKSIVAIPKAILVPAVGFMTIIGTFAIRNSISDVIIMICLGVFGWIVGRFGFAASPIVLGLILGPIAEQGFVQSWTIGAATNNLAGVFFGRPISQAIVAFTLLTLLYPAFSTWKQRRKTAKAGAN
jgi:putative tricarboxylic transport membrane protein